jgi:hypothetical protein
MYDKTKAEAAAYAVEIELLTQAYHHLNTLDDAAMDLEPIEIEILRRLRVLLDLEEGK